MRLARIFDALPLRCLSAMRARSRRKALSPEGRGDQGAIEPNDRSRDGIEGADAGGRLSPLCREAPALAAVRQRVVPAGAMLPRRSVPLLPALRQLGRGGKGFRATRARCAQSCGRSSASGVGGQAPLLGRDAAERAMSDGRSRHPGACLREAEAPICIDAPAREGFASAKAGKPESSLSSRRHART